MALSILSAILTHVEGPEHIDSQFYPGNGLEEEGLKAGEVESNAILEEIDWKNDYLSGFRGKKPSKWSNYRVFNYIFTQILDFSPQISSPNHHFPVNCQISFKISTFYGPFTYLLRLFRRLEHNEGVGVFMRASARQLRSAYVASLANIVFKALFALESSAP